MTKDKKNENYLKALDTAIVLFEHRVFRHRKDRLFVTNYSKKLSVKLHKKAKKDISDFIDRFLLEFPVAINLIRNPEYIESFSTDTTLNLQIQLYIGELLKKLNDERRGKLSNEDI